MQTIWSIPEFIREVVEQIAFEARDDSHIDKHSGVSQRMPITVMESAVSNAERRSLITGEKEIVPRIADIYAAIPSMTGKMELEYEGEQIGAHRIARDLIKRAAGEVFEGYFVGIDFVRLCSGLMKETNCCLPTRPQPKNAEPGMKRSRADRHRLDSLRFPRVRHGENGCRL